MLNINGQAANGLSLDYNGGVIFFFYVAEVWKKVTLLHYRGMEKALVGGVARQALDCYNCLGT